jgi:hypothetical protein
MVHDGLDDLGYPMTSKTFDGPYRRYPCGSLHVNGTWFYGTYALDNENHQPGDRLGATRGGCLDFSGGWGEGER